MQSRSATLRKAITRSYRGLGATRARLLARGHGRKTDALDAASVATVAQGQPDLRHVGREDHSAVLRLLSDRRDELTQGRRTVINRLHRLLRDLRPGGAPTELSARSVTSARVNRSAWASRLTPWRRRTASTVERMVEQGPRRCGPTRSRRRARRIRRPWRSVRARGWWRGRAERSSGPAAPSAR